MHILCLDDNQQVRDMLCAMLEEMEGHIVRGVPSIQEGLIFLDETYDVVIVDLNLECLSGEDYISIVKVRYPLLPIIVLSAYIESEEALLRLGADKVLSKPIDRDLLVTALEEVARGKETREQLL